MDYYRFAKAAIKSQRETRHKAEIARTRHEFRQERLERAQREKAEKLAKHKTTLQDRESTTTPAASPEMDAKKAAIQAALERAKAKKAQQASTETNPSTEGNA